VKLAWGKIFASGQRREVLIEGSIESSLANGKAAFADTNFVIIQDISSLENRMRNIMFLLLMILVFGKALRCHENRARGNNTIR